MTLAGFDAIAVGTEIQRRIGVKTVRDEPLARFTTMRVGGPADLFVVAHNAFELRGLVRFARARAIPFFILGRGSNLVIADAGIRGLVIHAQGGGDAHRGRPLPRRGGCPDGPRRHGDAAGGPDGPRVRPRDPGHGGRCRLGQRGRARQRDRRACSSPRWS